MSRGADTAPALQRKAPQPDSGGGRRRPRRPYVTKRRAAAAALARRPRRPPPPPACRRPPWPPGPAVSRRPPPTPPMHVSRPCALARRPRRPPPPPACRRPPWPPGPAVSRRPPPTGGRRRRYVWRVQWGRDFQRAAPHPLPGTGDESSRPAWSTGPPSAVGAAGTCGGSSGAGTFSGLRHTHCREQATNRRHRWPDRPSTMLRWRTYSSSSLGGQLLARWLIGRPVNSLANVGRHRWPDRPSTMLRWRTYSSSSLGGQLLARWLIGRWASARTATLASLAAKGGNGGIRWGRGDRRGAATGGNGG